MKKLAILVLLYFVQPIEAIAQDPIQLNTLLEFDEAEKLKVKADNALTPVKINPEVFNEKTFKTGIEISVETNQGVKTFKVLRIDEHIQGIKSVRAIGSSDASSIFSFSIGEGKIVGLLHMPDNSDLLFGYDSKSKFNYLSQKQKSTSECAVGHDEIIFIDEDISAEKEKVASREVNFVASSPSEVTNIDVLVAYTPAASLIAERESAGIELAIAQSINLSQTALDNSGIPIRLRLVHTVETENIASQPAGNVLRALTASPNFNPFGIEDGLMDEVHTLRDEYGADLVTLYSEVADVGGIAWVATNRAGSPDYGFSVNNVRVVDNSYTVAHEFGHNLGNLHSRTQASQTAPITGGVFQESVGYQDLEDSIATVMAYTAGGLTRVPYFSDPSRTFNGTVLGSPSPTSLTNASLSMKKMKSSIASYRKTKFQPPVSELPVTDIKVSLSEGETQSISFRIENNGASDLEYEIDFSNPVVSSSQKQIESSPKNKITGTTIFETGFEASDGFTPSLFQAINSWRSFQGSYIGISKTSPSSGVSNLRIVNDGGQGTIAIEGPYQNILPMGSYTISFDLKVSDSEDINNELFEVAFRDGKSAARIAGVRVLQGEYYVLSRSEVGLGIFVSTGVKASSDTYDNFRIDINSLDGNYYYYIGQNLISKTPFFPEGNTPAEISLLSTNRSADTYLDLDNLSIVQNERPFKWFLVSPTNGTITPGRSKKVSLFFKPEGLSSGVYSTVMTVNTNEAGVLRYEVPVQLTVTPPLSSESIEKKNTFVLEQNFPNPFNPTTNIRFSIPEPGNALVKVYNSLGVEVAELMNKRVNAGSHQVVFDASALASGVYFYKVIFGKEQRIGKMLLVK